MKQAGGGTGTKERINEVKLPEDCRTFESVGSWTMRYSPSEKKFLIGTIDYHPGSLELGKEDLIRMLAQIEENE